MYSICYDVILIFSEPNTKNTLGFSLSVTFQGNIDLFSESGSGGAQGRSRRQWLVLARRRNTANDRFPARPKEAKQTTQYGEQAL